MENLKEMEENPLLFPWSCLGGFFVLFYIFVFLLWQWAYLNRNANIWNMDIL